ncbi:MAG TPA: tripartite tricarboxylate transporter substrate binding protein [Syntrophorhabdaceae bacterium]|nr:tripartite tricarboxylate transporter substrate binding protein [Syntrophorhabdaceae bacterium]
MIKKMIFGILILVLMAGLLCGSLRAQQKYPAHQIEILCGFAPGTGPDILNRILAHHLEKQLGVTVVPVNKTGGGGVVAITTEATARPDGYTILNTGDYIIPVLTGQAGYAIEDLRVAAQVALNGTVLIVPADSPWRTFQDFMDYAKKNPGIKYCHPGVGTMAAMRMENMNRQGGLKLIGVPVQEVVASVLGKHVPIGLTSNATAKPLVEAGKIRILFSFDPAKDFGLDPSIPDFTKVFGKDVPDIEVATYLAVQAKTPPEIVTVLERAIENISKDPEFVNELMRNNFRASFAPGKVVMEQKIPKKLTLIKAILQTAAPAK